MIDFKKLVIRIWICLWIVLAILLIIKVLFNKYYPFIIENENIISICKFIDDNKSLRYIILVIFYIINCNLWILISTYQNKYKNIKELMICNLLIIFNFIIKNYNILIGNIVEIFTLIILPITLNIKKKYGDIKKKVLLPIVAYIIINIWVLNVYLVRGLKDVLSEMPTLIGIVFQLDYYVFLIITWIGVIYMGLWGGGWLLGKEIVELEAIKEKELAKKEPDLKLIEEINKAIEQKKEEK